MIRMLTLDEVAYEEYVPKAPGKKRIWKKDPNRWSMQIVRYVRQFGPQPVSQIAQDFQWTVSQTHGALRKALAEGLIVADRLPGTVRKVYRAVEG